MVTQTVSSQTILTGPRDWPSWISQIKQAARKHLLWPYIDPGKDLENLEVLEEPGLIEATPEDDLRQSDLTIKQIRDIADRRKLWERSLRIYDQRTEALEEMCIEMLRKLKDRVAPSDINYESMLIDDWRELRTNEKGTRTLDQWLDKWIYTYDICAAAGLPDVSGNRGIKDFIRAVAPMSLEWATIQNIALVKSTDPIDFLEVITEYRNVMKNS
ncbi:hypothetical protein VE00_08558 [Pseudogymnoascus sp. WSF 3629]|nr:hypothetical protein VE00_08558 [Pseudogymnoascus sp. WSF 3629]